MVEHELSAIKIYYIDIYIEMKSVVKLEGVVIWACVMY